MRAGVVCVAVGGVSVGGGGAQAAVTFLEQSRTLSASASIFSTGEADSRSASAPDFGPWAQNVAASVGGNVTFPFGFASASASQTSSLTPERLSMVGTASGTEAAPSGASASARSSFSVRFAIDAPEAVHVIHSHGTGATGGTTVGVSLVRSDGFRVFDWYQALSVTFPAGPVDLVLAPGEYTLTAACSAAAFRTAFSSVSVDFLIPAPGTVTVLGGLVLIGRRRR